MMLGSLFDGIGGFPLAAVHNGITPAWASEIEPFPMEVTKIRFPLMLHVGDITKLDGAALPPVEVICGGSPCQDLSVAGKRQGLAGERSGLFMEQVRIVKEMREADGRRGISDELVRPRYLVWENVPGAFSSAGGEDFRAVIEEIVRIKDSSCHVPQPDAGRWGSAGAAILGDKFSLAWRVLDAQFWGVAQRRRRIFLVADFGGLTAPEILFKQDSLPGNPAAGRGEGQGTSGAAQGGPDGAGGACLTPWDVQSRRIFGESGTWPALYGGDGGGHGYLQTEGPPGVMFCLNDQGGERMDVTEDVAATLRARMGSHQPLVFDNHGQDARFRGPVGTSQTVSAGFGLGGNNQPLVLASQQGHAGIGEGICPTLTSAAGTSGNNQPILFENRGMDHGSLEKKQGDSAIQQETFCIAGNIIDRQPQNGGNGFGYQQDISYTLTAMDHHAVFSPHGVRPDGEQVSAEEKNEDGEVTYQETVGSLCSDDKKGIGNQYVSQDKCIVEKRNLIRRLTPLECERLQGFPDGWTDIPGASDSARYKALGNSVAIPCVDFVLCGIACFLRKQAEREQAPEDV